MTKISLAETVYSSSQIIAQIKNIAKIKITKDRNVTIVLASINNRYKILVFKKKTLRIRSNIKLYKRLRLKAPKSIRLQRNIYIMILNR